MSNTITREALDQQIQRNRILSLFLMLVFVAGVIAAYYYYNEAKENLRKLQEAKGVVSAQGEQIDVQKQLIAEKEKTLEAVHLLKVFLDDSNTDKTYTEEEILNGLSKLAKEKEAEIEKRNSDRIAEIEKLFNKNSDPTRKAAQNTILRKYSNDNKLVPDLLNHALENRVNQTYSGSIYRTIDILKELSSATLIENQTLVNKFITTAKSINIGADGTETGKEVRMIEKKMRV